MPLDSTGDPTPTDGPAGWLEQRIPDAGDRGRRIFVGRTDSGWYSVYVDPSKDIIDRFDSSDEFIVRDQAAIYLAQYAPHEVVSWTTYFSD